MEETAIPRIGRRHDMRTVGGHHVAVVVHNTGRRELIVYDDADPDVGRQVLVLSEREADGRRPASAASSAPTAASSRRIPRQRSATRPAASSARSAVSRYIESSG